MPKYRVTIETSVLIEDVESPEEALKQAIEWTRESLEDSNAVGKVYRLSPGGREKRVLLRALDFEKEEGGQ